METARVDAQQVARFIYEKYVKAGAPCEVRLSGTEAGDILSKIESGETLPSLYDGAQAQVLQHICSSILPRYPGMPFESENV